MFVSEKNVEIVSVREYLVCGTKKGTKLQRTSTGFADKEKFAMFETNHGTTDPAHGQYKHMLKQGLRNPASSLELSFTTPS